MKNEKGFGCFMAPKSGVGRVSKCKMKHEKGLGCFSWFPRIVVKNKA